MGKEKREIIIEGPEKVVGLRLSGLVPLVQERKLTSTREPLGEDDEGGELVRVRLSPPGSK
jgi:hypothetical protein